MTTCSANNHQLPLSRIHRLIRPLRSSINSLSQTIRNQKERQQQKKLMLVKKHFYSQPKSSKAYLRDQQDYSLHSTNTSRKKYTTKKGNRSRNTATNPTSSPIFHSKTNRTNYLLTRQHPTNSLCITQQDQIELEVQIKIDKIILAYKNILDSTLSQPNHPDSNNTPNQNIHKLTTICARVIGNFIEHAIGSESNPNHQDPPIHDAPSGSENQSSNWLIELDWKTSVMDEWYDAIPLLYRRYALAQHALKMILLDFTLQPIPKQSKRSTSTLIVNYPQNLFQAILSLHQNYSSPLIQSQANLLLPSLFSLPTANWFDIYDDYSHKFDLQESFITQFYARTNDASFLEFCSDRALIGFMDLTMHVFGAWVMEKWIHQRESLIKSRLVWRSNNDSRQAGLESSDSEDLDPGMNEDAITEYDKQTSSIITKWIHSLVMSCLPHSVHCKSARLQLNAISRLIFDSLVAFNEAVCSKSDNYFLSLISVTIESHRLALFGLPMFNTASVDKPNPTSEWSSLHTPMRLQALIPKVVTSLDHKIFNKAAKLFFRAHRSTRLLAILPGLLSTRHQPIMPGLDELLEFVIKGEYSIEFVAKSWVESLLKSDPKSWWMEADSNTSSVNGSVASEEDDEIRSKGAQDVRTWLENWLPILDEAEKLRSNLSDHDPHSDDHHDQSSQDSDDEEHTLETVENTRDSAEHASRATGDPPQVADEELHPPDTKPPITCTCSCSAHISLPPPIYEEDESKPNLSPEPTNDNGVTPGSAAENNENPQEGENEDQTQECSQMATKKTQSSHHHHHHYHQHHQHQQIRVVVPTTKKRRRKSSFLSLPSTRSRFKRKKSATPNPHQSATPAPSSVRSSTMQSNRITTRRRSGAGSGLRSSHGERAVLSDDRLEDDPERGRADDEDDDEDDDQFDAMDLLMPNKRVKTPVVSSTHPSSLVTSSLNTPSAASTTNTKSTTRSRRKT